MKYTTKITPFENGFKGFLYKGDTLVYETEMKIDAVAISQELTTFIKNDQPTPILNSRTNIQNNLTKPMYTASPQLPLRKRGCCGG